MFSVFMFELIFEDHSIPAENLLTEMLDAFKQSILARHESEGVNFNPRPYFRMLHFFINHATACTQFLLPFASFLHSLAPVATPGFSITWVELLSNRNFMPRLFKLP